MLLWSATIALALVAVTATLTWSRLPGTLAMILVLGPALFVVIVGVAAFRTSMARRKMAQGCRAILAVGWTRYPDGCNYAVFSPEADPATDDPKLVVRLPLRRRTVVSPALLCGPTRPSRLHAASLFAPDGHFLGAGRVRPQASGLKVWRRRGSA
jgi:hypothetical protein